MRTVSFVEHLEFEYQGNLFSKALALGDVDNDQCNELVIGNVHGDLSIHKGTSTRPWRRCTDLGMITCLEIADVCNVGKNCLVTLSAEGWCHVFCIKPAGNDTEPAESEEDVRMLKPTHKQHLAANSKVLLVADIDGDGQCELVIGYSDRRVRSYRWLPSGADAEACPGALNGKFIPVENWQLAGQIGSMTVNNRSDGMVDLMVSQPGGTFVTLLDSHAALEKKTKQAKGTDEPQTAGAQSQGQSSAPPRVEVSPTKPSGSVASDTASQSEGGASGSGEKRAGTAAAASQEEVKGKEVNGADGKDGVGGLYPSLIYHPLGSARARNPGVTTEVVGNISRQKKGDETYVPNYYAICTLDGTLTLVDDDKILWSLYVDHQLFTLTKLDVTGDGTEEVVACSWDGQTYIVNLNRDVVRFQFEENVAAFCAGYYAVSGHNVPCLIYVSFNNRILVYYNIQMPEVGCSNLIHKMEQREGVQELLTCLNVDGSNPAQVRQFYHWCLYGFHPKPS